VVVRINEGRDHAIGGGRDESAIAGYGVNIFTSSVVISDEELLRMRDYTVPLMHRQDMGQKCPKTPSSPGLTTPALEMIVET